jgi:hypothetical protein
METYPKTCKFYLFIYLWYIYQYCQYLRLCGVEDIHKLAIRWNYKPLYIAVTDFSTLRHDAYLRQFVMMYKCVQPVVSTLWRCLWYRICVDKVQ